MTTERSCGAVVFARKDGQTLFVLVQEKSGMYSLPKGHMEGSETELETAQREILEETGLSPVWMDGFCRRMTFSPKEKRNTFKQITFFLARADSGDIAPREGDVLRAVLVPYEEAMRLIRHEDMRRILTDAYEFISG